MSNCVLTTSFPLDCRDAVGGIKKVWIVESSAKATLTQNASGIVTALTLAGGKNFFGYELRKATGHFETDAITNDVNGTTFYSGKLTLKLYKMEVYKRNEIKLLASQSALLIIVLDRIGNYWLIGNNNGCTLLTAKGQSGTAMGDFNGWDLEFEYMEEDMPLMLSSGVTTALGL